MPVPPPLEVTGAWDRQGLPSSGFRFKIGLDESSIRILHNSSHVYGDDADLYNHIPFFAEVSPRPFPTRLSRNIVQCRPSDNDQFSGLKFLTLLASTEFNAGR
jgi:hypothetical protein